MNSISSRDSRTGAYWTYAVLVIIGFILLGDVSSASSAGMAE
jgi:hypothetical protein